MYCFCLFISSVYGNIYSWEATFSQRAFRQRKEKHVKQLEHKLAALGASRSQIGCENAQLQGDLKRVAVENAMLRSLSNSNSQTNHGPSEPLSGSSYSGLDVDSSASPQLIKAADPHDSVGRNFPDSESMLHGGEIWHFIVGHRLFREGLVDMITLRQQLQYLHRTNTNIPVATEATLTEYIQKSLRRY
jgi:hypothetical protein